MTILRAALLLVLILALGLSRVHAAVLGGTLVDDHGVPVAGATAIIYTAALRDGDSPFCPSCWADCKKAATTDANGHFRFDNISDRLIFRLLVVAHGFQPTFLPKADPRSGAVAGKLTRRDLSARSAAQWITGIVTDLAGKPIAGAIIEPQFDYKGMDPMAITDETGRFVLGCPAGAQTVLTVQSEGHAPAAIGPFLGGAPPVDIKLGAGVAVSGRVLEQGTPLANVVVGIVQLDRSGDRWLGPMDATTDAQGFFHFDHAPPNEKLALYGKMASLAHHGAVPAREVDTGKDGSNLNAGDLAVTLGTRFAVRLVESDHRPFPAGTRILISRSVAWDAEIVDVAPDGHLSVADLPPAEQIEISVPRNHWIESVNAGFTVDNLNHSVKGVCQGGRMNLTINLTGRSEAQMATDWKAHFTRDRYSDFFQTEGFTPGQVDLFVADVLEYDVVRQQRRASGASASECTSKAADALEARMTSDLGKAAYLDYLGFEGADIGNAEISQFYHPPRDNWLTDALREKLARALGGVLYRDRDRYNIASLSKSDQFAYFSSLYDQLDAAGRKVLPQEKQSDFGRALAGMRQLSMSGLSQQPGASVN